MTMIRIKTDNSYLQIPIMFQRFCYRSLALASILFLLSGCSALSDLTKNIQKPNVSVENVRVTGFDFQQIELTYDLKVENPNALSMDLLSYDYELKLNENSFVKGQQARRTTIEASGDSRIEVPVSLNFQQVYRAVSNLRGADEASYSFLSTLTFDLPVLGRTNMPIEKDGKIPLLQLPDIRLRDFQIESLSLSGAKLNLQLDFDNPNGFGLTVNGLDYNLDVNGDSWSDGTALQDVSIKKNGVTELNIPLSLNFSDIGMSAFRALSGSQNLDYDLQGNLDVNIAHELLGNTSFNFNREGSVSLSNNR